MGNQDHQVDDVSELMRLARDADTDPRDAVWAIFDRRTETQCPLVHDALTAAGMTDDGALDAISTEMLEVLARLLPNNATNSTFDDLLWDLDDALGTN
jgi:hypothetical protein